MSTARTISKWNRWAPGRLVKEASDGVLHWRENVTLYGALFDIDDPPTQKRASLVYNLAQAKAALADDPDLGLLKYRGHRAECVTADPKLTLGYGLYAYGVSKSKWAETFLVLEARFDVRGWLLCDNYSEGFGWISNVMKKTGVDGFHLLVDLATLAGYKPAMSDEDVYEGTMEWAGLSIERGGGVEWEARLKDKAKQFFHARIREKGWVEKYDTQEYAGNPVIWGTTGSVLYDRKRMLTGTDERGIVKAESSKWAAAAVIDPATVLAALDRKQAQYAKTIVKRETKKARLVIAADLESYWQQDYLSESVLDYLLRGSTASTLWQSAETTGRMWAAMAQRAGVSMPLDQSEFDHNQTARMIASVLSGIREASEPFASAGWLKVFDNAMYAIRTGYIVAAGRKVPYRNGVLSGWRWTAMLDTLLNLFVSEMAMEDGGVQPLGIKYQGDDVESEFRSVGDAFQLWQRTKNWGFIVNPFKFFVSCDGRSEFLRRYSVRGRVAGYPARSVNALTWRNPINTEPAPGVERLAEMYDQWKLFAARLESSVLPGAPLDLARANKLPLHVVKTWIEAPIAWGGASTASSSAESVIVEASVPEQIVPEPGAGIRATAESVARLFPLKHPLATVRRWWGGVVKWRRADYTQAGYKLERVRAPIPIQPGNPPQGGLFDGLRRVYYNLIPEAADLLIPKSFYPGMAPQYKRDLYAGNLLFSIPAVAGADSTWVATLFGPLRKWATATFAGLRSPSSTAYAQVQDAVNRTVASKFQRLAAGIMVVR